MRMRVVKVKQERFEDGPPPCCGWHVVVVVVVLYTIHSNFGFWVWAWSTNPMRYSLRVELIVGIRLDWKRRVRIGSRMRSYLGGVQQQ